MYSCMCIHVHMKNCYGGVTIPSWTAAALSLLAQISREYAKLVHLLYDNTVKCVHADQLVSH